MAAYLNVKLRVGADPAGRIQMTNNGVYGVKDYAEAFVNVLPALQDKTATPTEQQQEIRADAGYDGLDSVTVERIPAEYVKPEGTKTITENGTYNIKSFENVVVNTPENDPYEMLERVMTDPDAAGATIEPVSALTLNNLTHLVPYAFYKLDAIETITANELINAGDYSFASMAGLKSVNIPKCEEINAGAFRDDTELLSIFAPAVTWMDGEYIFCNCQKLEELFLPSLETMGTVTFLLQNCSGLKKLRLPRYNRTRYSASYMLYGCTALESFDVGQVEALNNASSYPGMGSLTALKLLAIHNTQRQVVPLINTLAAACPISTGAGFVLVPRSHISDYTAASNWSAFYAAGTQFLAIEDYTQDGTAAGELDEDKIDALLA